MAPGWSTAAKPEDEDRGLVVTADTIVLGMRNLSLPKLDKAFKDGWQPSFHTLPVRDGEGYFSVFSTPMGVTAAMIADKNEVFARNLHRASCETWVTDAERAKLAPAGYVALYVLNPGVLDRPTPEYPLMHDGQADVFEGVPGGVVARGDGALIPVTANNGVWGGQMGMGKSNAGRVYILGCCTDPLCEVEVFVFASNGDYDAYAPRLATYVKGADDATAAAAVQRLYELLDETGRREGRLAELGAKKLTRRIASQYPDMRPVVILFSECHELFGHPEYGELAAELAVKVIKRARKTGIVLCFDTQSSRAAAIPPALVELVSVNVCFYVKTWRSNDGFLGDGSFQGGIRATELRPNRDVGRSVVTGISDSQFELLKWYFVEVDDDTGWDAAAEVIARCMRDLAPGTRVSGGDGAQLPVMVQRDLLDDVAMVIDGPWRVLVNELPHRLKRLDGTWPEYRKLTGAQLRKRLSDLGVRTTNTDNKPELDPAELHRAIGERERMSELP
jgi:S-DNA-T family DNA segregation ATPase FtsK/SpoIIIE